MARRILSEQNHMAQCEGCGRMWDYVNVDGFGNVTAMTHDIEMHGARAIHTNLRGMPYCGRQVRVVRMGTQPQGAHFFSDFLKLRDDDGKPRSIGSAPRARGRNGSKHG